MPFSVDLPTEIAADPWRLRLLSDADWKLTATGAFMRIFCAGQHPTRVTCRRCIGGPSLGQRVHELFEWPATSDPEQLLGPS